MMISACKASKAGGAIFLESAHVTGWPEGVLIPCLITQITLIQKQ